MYLIRANLIIRRNINLYNSIRNANVKTSAKIKDDFMSKYFLLLFPTTAFGLGTWQVYRWRWKLNLIDSLNKKLLQEPIELPDDLEEINKLEYTRVKVKGRFEHEKEMYLSPRSLNTGEHEKQGTSFFKGPNKAIGSWVVTPFVLSENGRRILVNRGWVSRSNMDPEKRLKGQIKDEIELVGVIRLNEKRPVFGSKNDQSSKVWHYRDVEGLSQLLNAEPIFIDADFKSTVSDGPIGGQTKVTLRNEHFSYILTWYGLSLFTFHLWYRKFYQRKPIVF